MKVRGKPRQVYDSRINDYRYSMYPTTREEAIEEDLAKYWPMEPCPVHGGDPVVYTRTGSRGCCAQYGAVDEYNAAVAAGEPINITEAREKGLAYYWRPLEHQQCGHPGKTRLDGGCYLCGQEKATSPRQLAKSAGETWYMPAVGDECRNGHLAPRRVATGGCKQCEDDSRPDPIAKEPNLRKTNPDMVIDWEQAKTLGFKMYRTGEPCSRGHRDWRYVSTRNCLACMGR